MGRKGIFVYGQGVQRDVGISKLEKAFYLFPRPGRNPKEFNAPEVQLDFIYEVDVNFDDPKSAVEKMMRLTEEVEVRSLAKGSEKESFGEPSTINIVSRLKAKNTQLVK